MTTHATRLAEATALIRSQHALMIDMIESGWDDSSDISARTFQPYEERLSAFLAASTSPIASTPAPPETKPAECRGGETQTAGGDAAFAAVVAGRNAALEREDCKPADAGTAGGEKSGQVWTQCDCCGKRMLLHCVQTDYKEMVQHISACLECWGKLRADVARLTGERDAAVESGEVTLALVREQRDAAVARAEACSQSAREQHMLAGTYRRERDQKKLLLNSACGRAEQAEAERDRLKAEMEKIRGELIDLADPEDMTTLDLAAAMKCERDKLKAGRREVVVARPDHGITGLKREFAWVDAIIAAGGKIA